MQNLKKCLALCIFGIAFGLLEAIVVFYIQTILGLSHSNTALISHNSYSVLLNLGFIAFITTHQPILKDVRLTSVEMFREFSTIIMLICLAYIAGKTIKQRVGAFLIAFSFWDIFYYIFLHFLIGWPAGLLNIDVYFLIPVPWIGPVLTPVIISILLLIIGIKLFLSQGKRKIIPT